MLQSLDALMGLSVVMLVTSMAVMLVTQGFNNAIRNRARHLRGGLTDLLMQLDDGITQGIGGEIADAVLFHPLVRGSTRRPGSVIKREELVTILLALAAKEPGSNPDNRLGASARSVLTGVLKTNGIPEPDKALSRIRMRALELERIDPALPASTRVARAIASEASSELVAKIYAWFDGMIDRVSERFTVSARVMTVVVAIVAAGALQLDTIGIINRLSLDTSFRRALVEQAVKLQSQSPSSPDGAPQTQVPPTIATAPDSAAVSRAIDAVGLSVPSDFRTWSNGWTRTNILGVVLSVFLLTLGAPFWFNVLQGSLRLRPVLATQDDLDRARRQGRETGGKPAEQGSEGAQP